MSKEETNIVMKEIEKTLKCQLTVEERLEVAGRLADSHQTLEEAQAELEALKADFKGRIGAAESNIGRYSALLRAGYIHRPVKCAMQMDYASGMVAVVRNDTSELVEEREMTAQEKQMELDVE